MAIYQNQTVLKLSTRSRYVRSKPGTLTLDHQYPENRHLPPGTEASTMRIYLVAQDYIGVLKLSPKSNLGTLVGRAPRVPSEPPPQQSSAGS